MEDVRVILEYFVDLVVFGRMLRYKQEEISMINLGYYR